MIDLKDVIVFAFVSVAQAGSPGPSVVLVINNSITHGVNRAIIAILWDISGMALLALIFALAAKHIVEDQALLIPLQLIGGLYLLFLAWEKTKKNLTTSENDLEVDFTPDDVRLGCQSFLVAVLNPKAFVFFATIFPTFVSKYSVSNDESTLNASILIIIYLYIRYSVLTIYSVLAERLLDKNRKTIATTNAFSAVIFSLFSFYLFFAVYTSIFVNKFYC